MPILYIYTISNETDILYLTSRHDPGMATARIPGYPETGPIQTAVCHPPGCSPDQSCPHRGRTWAPETGIRGCHWSGDVSQVAAGLDQTNKMNPELLYRQYWD